MDIEAYEDGVPSWVELTTPDPAGAGFYGRLFGWTYREPSGAARRTGLLRGRPVAAVGHDPDTEQAAWTMYVNVADADRTAEKVTVAGGSVLRAPHDLGTAGRAALFADHSGARFAVWQAGAHQGAGAVAEPGTFSWSELITDDPEKSAAFYGSVLGWTVSEPEGPLRRRAFRSDGRPRAGLLPRPPAMPASVPPYWDVYFAVADAADAAEAVTGLGGSVLMPATAMEHGTIAVLTDPAGAVFTVSSAAPAAAAAQH
ncbi:VOC family protein [Streptomyces sp. NBC_01476]|uniref:VOC family protein n=1 Tax=Streptomyces sp. NBC_01476 TaxID=2903881 RepID=UPI002E34888B|nr:VOC family protein [Streptomyces sp. NBC_01476]